MELSVLLTHVIRGTQLLFAILVLGLAGDSTSFYFSGFAPSQTSFMVFNAVWTILAVLYFMLAPRFMKAAAHPFVVFAVDALTMLFWFSGFIALAVLVSATAPLIAAINADDNGLFYDYGATKHWYQVSAAATAFGAFEWILFVVTTLFSAMAAFKGGSNFSGRKTEQTSEQPV